MNQKNDIKFFVYCRKSSESEDRQAASIGDQLGALARVIELEQLNVVETFTEEKSSKDPGRPVFNDMLARIHTGEADGILCWDNDRLSRNPIDGGAIAWMLQKGVLKIIKTPGRSYYPEDAGLLLSVEQGRATDYVIRLSKNVKRGFRGKIEKGWRPGATPIGYKNIGDVGNKTIAIDEDRFDIVRKMWDYYLTGQYSVRELNTIVNKQWGLTTPQRRKLGGKELSMSHMYRILNDVFYTGMFLWKDPDTGEATIYQGVHTPMITEQEYRRAQVLLGAKGKPQPKTKEFSYTGLIRCGECDSAITAEEKNQIICTTCKHKFSYNNKTDCPKCQTTIESMHNPTILKYVYYRCSRKKGPCSQKYIRVEDFETQFSELLDEIEINQEYIDVALEYLRDTEHVEVKDQQKIIESLHTSLKQCEERILRLSEEYTSAQNADYSIYSQDEFKKYKKRLLDEAVAMRHQITDTEKKASDSFMLAERTLSFCALAKKRFESGDQKTRRVILSSIGSNLTMKDKIVSFNLLHPFQLILNEKKANQYQSYWLEPGLHIDIKRQMSTFVPICPALLRRQDSNLRPIDYTYPKIVSKGRTISSSLLAK